MINAINNVTIIGGNGTLGKKIAGIFASFGNANVYVVSRTKEKSIKAIESAALSVKAYSIKKHMYPMTYEDLHSCISKSDLIFESVSENYEVKDSIHKQINDLVNHNCVIATGTSGLSINKLAENYNDNNRSKFVGMHFFNPPYNMTLCELIPSKYNENTYIYALKDYLEKVLYRDVVIAKDEPAFVANRIGFCFLNEALIYAEMYKSYGGIDYIDSILGKYTGRNMAPLETVNYVGLDIHKSIVDNVFQNGNDSIKDSFVLPEFVKELIAENRLGVKVGEGLYKREEGKNLVYDIETKQYREIRPYRFSFKDKAINEFKKANYLNGFNIIKKANSIESNICITFLIKYIMYSLEVGKNVCSNIRDCDSAMAHGFNWIPPLALIEALGGVDQIKEIIETSDMLDKKTIDLLDNYVTSDFSYKKFIKAIE